MEKMDKGLSVPKWAENTTKCPKHYLPKPKVWDFDENRLHWHSVLRQDATQKKRCLRKLFKFKKFSMK